MTKDDKVFIMTRLIFKVTLEKKMLSLGKIYRMCESADASEFTKFVWAGK